MLVIGYIYMQMYFKATNKDFLAYNIPFKGKSRFFYINGIEFFSVYWTVFEIGTLNRQE